MDALHVAGNQTIFISSQNLVQFRNLPYYAYSNASEMASLHTQLYAEKMLFGWFFPARKKWRELIIFNALGIPEKPFYREYGYGLDRLFRAFHINLVHSRAGNANPEWRLLLGASYSFPVKPKSYDRNPGQVN
jgi:hypothetical protein